LRKCSERLARREGFEPRPSGSKNHGRARSDAYLRLLPCKGRHWTALVTAPRPFCEAAPLFRAAVRLPRFLSPRPVPVEELRESWPIFGSWRG
jgi:hypothetical protein